MYSKEFNTAEHTRVDYSIIYCTELYSYCTELYSIELYFTVLNYTVLCCAVLYSGAAG
jgi:hypothetical protein